MTKEKKEVSILSYEDIEAVLDSAYILHGFHNLPGRAWQCYFAILAAYGKRVSEVIELQKRHVRVSKDGFLSITFSVRKKRRKVKDPVTGKTHKEKRIFITTKRITLKNPITQIILSYVETLKQPNDFLFPAPGTKTGHIYPQYAWEGCKKILEHLPLPDLDNHTLRHTLATHLAQHKHTSWELKDWFDWESVVLADNYVQAAGMSTEKISAREW